MDDRKPTLDYATRRTARPDREGKLIIGLLITFLALGMSLLAIVIYMSNIA